MGAFQPGGAALAAAAEAPVLVVAHNAGTHWPAHRLRKTPGTIEVRIAPALETAGLSAKQVNSQAHSVMEKLVAEAGEI